MAVPPRLGLSHIQYGGGGGRVQMFCGGISSPVPRAAALQSSQQSRDNDPDTDQSQIIKQVLISATH